MADTITVLKSGLVKNITAIDVDWDQGQQTPLESIQFIPGAGSDKLVVKEGSASGAVIFQGTAPAVLDGGFFIKYFNGALHQPYIDFSDCTLSSGHMVIIERR